MKTFMMTLVAVLLLSFMPINVQASLGTGKAKVTYVSQKKSKKKSKGRRCQCGWGCHHKALPGKRFCKYCRSCNSNPNPSCPSCNGGHPA